MTDRIVQNTHQKCLLNFNRTNSTVVQNCNAMPWFNIFNIIWTLIIRPQFRIERNEIFFLNIIVTRRPSRRNHTIRVKDV